jgi:hypothetical protein
MATSGDINYPDKRSVRKQTQQQGRYNLYNALRRPLMSKLRLYERMARQDLTIRSALNTRVDSIIGTIGDVIHPDKEIQEFHRDNLKRLEDGTGKNFKSCLRNIQFTTDWAGFSVSEVCYSFDFGSLHVEDILTYHPSTLVIYPNKKGLLVDNQETMDGYHKSGIYQYAINFAPAEQHLDLWKHIYLGRDCDYGNYYGHSLVAPAYKWFRLKEVLIEMMISAMNKLGTRLLWVRSHNTPTEELVLNPATGEERPLTTLELIRNQIEMNEGAIDTLVLPQVSPDYKPEIGSVQMSDNFGDTFLNTLAYVDQESVRHIIPYFLLMDTDSNESARERRMEIYFNDVYNQREALINVAVQKILMPLQTWNFNRAAAKIPPTFARIFSDRPEDRVATMQMVTGLTETGYLNPTNPMDWGMVREMVRLAGREMTEADLKFINEVVIEPLQKPEPAAGAATKKPTAGRPKGVSKPLSTRSPAKPASSGSTTKKNLKQGG